jgi:hypothetical protein
MSDADMVWPVAFTFSGEMNIVGEIDGQLEIEILAAEDSLTVFDELKMLAAKPDEEELKRWEEEVAEESTTDKDADDADHIVAARDDTAQDVDDDKVQDGDVDTPESSSSPPLLGKDPINKAMDILAVKFGLWTVDECEDFMTSNGNITAEATAPCPTAPRPRPAFPRTTASRTAAPNAHQSRPHDDVIGNFWANLTPDTKPEAFLSLRNEILDQMAQEMKKNRPVNPNCKTLR